MSQRTLAVLSLAPRFGRFVHFALLAMVVAAGAARADNVDGEWSSVYDWPLIAVHAALTPDGRVLTYGTNGDGKQTGYFIYDIWDPSAGPGGGHMTLDNMTLTDIFCSSQIILPQSGEILIAGGDNWTGSGTNNQGNNNSNIFDYGDNTLARSANMNRARWYSSSTALVNGEVYIQGGSGGGDRPEVRQTNGVFRLLTNASTSSYAALFPRNFLAPDGRVFGYDTSGKMYFVDPAGSGSLVSAGQFSSANAGWTSGAAMFRPGKILQVGGNSNGAMVVDINGPQPITTITQSMSSKRMWVSVTVLPDGRVLATGGSRVENKLTDVNNSAEIWNPATGQWHVGPSAVKARLYHSSALLLPDATVLVAGGGAPGPLVNTNMEIYRPPYLFDGNGDFAARPEILSAPDTAEVGDSLPVQVDTAVSRVTLVKTGSVTHSVNMDQRFLELPFSSSGNMLDVALPARASDTPPGFYMLFVIDESGVPSVARMLRINIDPTPNTSVDYTPAIGGSNGSAFQLACNADEVLVGVHGRYATYVNQIGPQCVQIDQLGRWIGDPVDRSVTGTNTGGTSFSKSCPRDFAVSGFKGRSGQYVNQLNVECRALTPVGGLSGAGQFLGATGGSGGSSKGPYNCGTNNPVYALYGRSGSWLDNFGMLCRPGVITPISINSDPVIVNPGPSSGTVGLPVDLQISASDGDGDVLSFSATGLPAGLQIDAGSGRITGIPTAEGAYPVEVTVSDGTTTDSTTFTFNIALALPLTVDEMPTPPPELEDTEVSYSASANGGVNVVYDWDFGDGTSPSGFSASPSIDHTFTEPGIFYVTLTVNDDFGNADVQTFVQRIYAQPTDDMPASSTRIAYEARNTGNARVWVVNQDNDSVSVFDAVTEARLAEVPVGTAPRSVAVAPDGRAWVTNQSSASISIIEPVTLTVDQTVVLPYASQPYGIAFSAVTNAAFVALEATGSVLKLDASSGSGLGSVAVGPDPRHVSVNGSGTLLYVSRFVTPRQPGEETAAPQTQSGGENTGGEVLVVDAGSMILLDTIVLRHSDRQDAENQGSGVPNYLGAVTISPDGGSAWVPSKQDNIRRGSLRSGANINFQNTVRAIGSRIDLDAGSEVYPDRIDFDNSSVASAAVMDPLGIYMFVALETSREIAVVDVHGGDELFRFDTGRAPQGLAISPDGLTLYVSNFMDRSVGVYDLTELQTEGKWNAPPLATWDSVADEKLSAVVLKGKQFFYDARDTRLALDSYMSCASCHNDGAQDGRVWDLTGMGEGLRNTIELRGTGADNGRLHWSENFDEVQDFEGQIRILSAGTGLMTNADFNTGTRSDPLGDPKAGVSPDLDALAAYVASLNTYADSPHRNGDGTLTAAGLAGREIFRRENCAGCHAGAEFTDSDQNLLHDIGTIKASSGSRLGGPLPGIDTPTLRGTWNSAPYLHDGSAATLGEAVAAHDGVSLDSSDMAALVAYLQQIDGNEQTAPLNNAPDISSPGSQAGNVGDTVSLPLQASDPDAGDTLAFSSASLPPSLGINPSTGRISGTLQTEGDYSVTVTVQDQLGAGDSTTFSWAVGPRPNTPPSVADPGPQAGVAGDTVFLQILASDADGDPLSYGASDLPPGLGIGQLDGRITGQLTVAGSYTSTVSVSDGFGGTTDRSFSWTVDAPAENVAPVVTHPGAQASDVGDSVSLGIDASDANGDTLLYAASNLPTGLAIDATTGVIAGIPDAANVWSVTVTVDDQAGGQTSVSFDWTVSEAVVLDIGPLGRGITGKDNATGSGYAMYTGERIQTRFTNPEIDPASADHVLAVRYFNGNWQYVNDDTYTNFVPRPTDLLVAVLDFSADTVTMLAGTDTTVNGIRSGYADGDLVIAPNMWNGRSNAGEFGISGTWILTNGGTPPPANSPPVLASPGDQAGTVNSGVDLQLAATDADGDPITYSAAGLPPGLAIGASTGRITGTLATVGVYAVTLSASDSRGGVDSEQVSWNVSPAGGTVLDIGPLGRGITGKDNATGSGYAMYTGERIQTRFTNPAIDPTSADHVLAVRYFNGNWQYVNDDTYTNFVPRPTDLLVAVLDFSADTVTMLAGTDTTVNGIRSGYADGDLVITPNMWNGRSNAGEFGVSGTWILTNGGTPPPANSPPVLASPGDQAGTVNSGVDLQLAASDADGDPITYSAAGLPPGLAIGASTGRITGTLTTAGVYAVTLTASDSRGGVDSEQVSWNVSPAGGTVLDIGPLGRGITGKDNATGSGYAMYTGERIQTRFTNPEIDPTSADHVLAVRYFNGNWQYVNDDTYTDFVPRPTDLLVAVLDFSADTVTMLAGTDTTVNGMKSGYNNGDLVITPNMWNGRSNAGEFGITGTFIVIN